MGTHQRFCLRWNNHQSNLLNVFDELLQQETLVDVTLACEGQSIKAHKVVLSACSNYFRHLFLDNPCQHPIVILKDVSFVDMKILLDFMYKGEVDISHDQLANLLTVADNLKVKGLAEVRENMAATQETDSTNHCNHSHQPQSELSSVQAKDFTRVSPSRDMPPSPKRRKKRRASSVSTGNSEVDCGAGKGEGGNSRPSTPADIPIIPKTETYDMSYEEQEKTLATMLDNSAPSLGSASGAASQHSNLSQESTSQLAYHLSLSQKDTAAAAVAAAEPREFETDSGEVDVGMPFTQHLSVGSEESDSLVLIPPPAPRVILTSSASRTDTNSCLASTSALTLASSSSASQSRSLHSQETEITSLQQALASDNPPFSSYRNLSLEPESAHYPKVKVDIGYGVLVDRDQLDSLLQYAGNNPSRLARSLLMTLFSKDELIGKTLTGKTCNANRITVVKDQIDPIRATAIIEYTAAQCGAPPRLIRQQLSRKINEVNTATFHPTL